MRFFLSETFIYYICKKYNDMKVKLTACMWALALSLLVILLSKNDATFYCGIVLLALQTLLWGNLMKQLKED